MAEVLSNEICQKVLENYTEKKNLKVVDYTVKPISENSEGYMGEHYNLTINYQNGNENLTKIFFMKNKPMKSDVHKQMEKENNIYIREIFMYDILFKEFEKYGFDTSFASKSFYCIPNQAIIMENLKIQGFELLERNIPFTMDKIKATLKSLALFHAAGFSYEKIKSKEIGKPYKLTDDYEDIIRELYFCQHIGGSETIKKFQDNSNRTILALIDKLPNDESMKLKFKNLYNSYDMGKEFVVERNLPKTIGHGDLWSNNMMFKFDKNNKPIQCVLVDYQITRYFYPGIDVILAVYSNTDSEFRKNHLEDLFLYYYKIFSETVKNYGFDANDCMTYEQFIKGLNLIKVDALSQVVFTNTIICIPKGTLDEIINDGDGFADLVYNNAKISCAAFDKIEVFRKVLTELLYDLYDALIAAQKL